MFFDSNMAGNQSKALFQWKVDEPGKELYWLSIDADKTIMLAYGRYAHGSGSQSVSWQAFLDGEMNDLVEKCMGKNVLMDILQRLKELD